MEIQGRISAAILQHPRVVALSAAVGNSSIETFGAAFLPAPAAGYSVFGNHAPSADLPSQVGPDCSSGQAYTQPLLPQRQTVVSAHTDSEEPVCGHVKRRSRAAWTGRALLITESTAFTSFAPGASLSPGRSRQHTRQYPTPCGVLLTLVAVLAPWRSVGDTPLWHPVPNRKSRPTADPNPG